MSDFDELEWLELLIQEIEEERRRKPLPKSERDQQRENLRGAENALRDILETEFPDADKDETED